MTSSAGAGAPTRRRLASARPNIPSAYYAGPNRSRPDRHGSRGEPAAHAAGALDGQRQSRAHPRTRDA
jgi:hypothetical protein